MDCSECTQIFRVDLGCSNSGCPVQLPPSCETPDGGATCTSTPDCSCPYDVCSSDADCGGDEFCQFQVASCGAVTGVDDGYCLALNQLGAGSDCSAPELHDGQVCGCDGVTYPTECEALRAGVKGIKYGAPCL